MYGHHSNDHTITVVSHCSRPVDVVRTLWAGLRLPPDTLSSLSLEAIPRPLVPSSYKITGGSSQANQSQSRNRTSLHRTVRARDFPRPVSADELRSEDHLCRSPARRYRVLIGEVQLHRWTRTTPALGSPQRTIRVFQRPCKAARLFRESSCRDTTGIRGEGPHGAGGCYYPVEEG